MSLSQSSCYPLPPSRDVGPATGGASVEGGSPDTGRARLHAGLCAITDGKINHLAGFARIRRSVAWSHARRGHLLAGGRGVKLPGHCATSLIDRRMAVASPRETILSVALALGRVAFGQWIHACRAAPFVFRGGAVGHIPGPERNIVLSFYSRFSRRTRGLEPAKQRLNPSFTPVG